MTKELTIDQIERQNILNNRFAVERIRESLDITGMLFEGEYRFTKQMVADFYGVDVSTVDRYLASHSDELKHNGYILSKGKQLKEFKLQFGHLINEASKTTQLGLFDFRSFLNLGMLLSDSEAARRLRSYMLDIVIATINEQAGGGTKFINRRDVNYLPSAVREVNYRKELTSAINDCVDGHRTMKYAQVTDYIYQAIFRENAAEYKDILRLGTKDTVRDTLYSEVLLCVASFENGVGAAIRDKSAALGRRLLPSEVKELVVKLSLEPAQKPYLDDARTKMSSRDFSFRNAYHGNIAEYLQAVTPEEYEKFIGELSVDFDRILEDNADVLKRLKQADSE